MFDLWRGRRRKAPRRGGLGCVANKGLKRRVILDLWQTKGLRVNSWDVRQPKDFADSARSGTGSGWQAQMMLIHEYGTSQ
jgi:hypothetical protein